jgi:membrane protein YdbS with pleckstrin-like domain
VALPITLQSDEKLVAVKKRHPVYVILKGIAAVVIAGLLIWGISWVSSNVASASALWPWLYVVVILAVALYVGILLYRYYNDLWIVTNQRLVDSLRRTPFNHELASTDLINVQDINVHKRGIMPTIFNFGDVVCQTASTHGTFSFSGVGHPAQLMEDLDRLRDEARRQSQNELRQAMGAASAQTALPAN